MKKKLNKMTQEELQRIISATPKAERNISNVYFMHVVERFLNFGRKTRRPEDPVYKWTGHKN